jgi:hypothetical protein
MNDRERKKGERQCQFGGGGLVREMRARNTIFYADFEGYQAVYARLSGGGKSMRG